MVKDISIQDATHRLGLRLRQARIQAGLTQALLAARAGVSVRVVGRMEQGDMSVGLGRWFKVSKALELLDSWDSALLVAEDPFAQYDREQSHKTEIGKRRVRPRKLS